MLWNKDY